MGEYFGQPKTEAVQPFQEAVVKYGLNETERNKLLQVMARLYKYDIPYNPNVDVQAKVILENRQNKE